MGGVLSQPLTDKNYNQGEGLGLRYGLCSMQGWRTEMEDAHDVKIGLKYGLEDWSYFAVFDGHAGKRAAAFAAYNLLEFILRDSQLKLKTQDLPGHIPIEPKLDEPSDKWARVRTTKWLVEHSDSETLTGADDNTDEQSSSLKSKKINSDLSPENATPTDVPSLLSSRPELVSLPVAEQLESVKEAIRSGFLKIDESMRASNDLSGCTAVCALVSPTHLFIANCGDSRAVISDTDGAFFATEDHKPLNPKERQRIVKAGGSVGQRINGTLAVSRALGDFEFKKNHDMGPCEQLVSPEPEVFVIERRPKDEFMILACDGIWDVMSDNELCKFVQYKLTVEPNVQSVCSSILDLCLHRGSRDNMSIIIVVFENAPKFSEEKRAEEELSDKALTEYADSLCEQQKWDWYEFLCHIKRTLTDTPDDPLLQKIKLPVGIGIEAKYDMLHKIFDGHLNSSKESDQHDDTTNQ